VTGAKRVRPGRLLSWALAVAALGFVAWSVPVRDRCWDPHAPASTKVAVRRDDTGCVLYLRTGTVRIDAAACRELRCEPGVASAVAHARVGWLAGLFGLYVLGALAWAARWQALLGFAGVDLRLAHVWRISTEAQAGGILLPGGVGGDALRVAGIVALPARPGQARAPVAIVIASVLLDRAVGLSVLSAVAATLGFAWGGLRDATLAFVLAGIPLAVLTGLVVLRRAPLERIRWLKEGRIGRAAGPVLEYVRDPRAPRAIARAALLSVVVACVQLAVVRGLVSALGGVPTAEKWVYVGSTMGFIVGAVPALPGGWGTTDAAYVFFLGLAGLPAGDALAVCLFYRLFWYLLGVAGAVLHVARPRALPLAAPPDGAQPPPA
jgi:uncharacterized membrane protein YbhN (UPF0104 family)